MVLPTKVDDQHMKTHGNEMEAGCLRACNSELGRLSRSHGPCLVHGQAHCTTR